MSVKSKVTTLSFIIVLGCALYFMNQNMNQGAGKDIVIYGNVDIRDVALGFRVPGRIEKLNYEEGDRVKKGQVLAVLDKDPYKEDLNLAKAQLAQAKALIANEEKLYDRAAKLFEIGGISQTDLDNALSARDQARATKDAAQAQLDKAKTNLKDAEIKAPCDGIILTRVREPGAIVAPNNSVYSLMLEQPIWIRTYVDEPSLGLIRLGQKAVITTDSGGTYDGQVGFISPQAEFTPKNVETTQLRTDLVYRLRVIITKPNETLRQGMPVTVVLKYEPQK